MGALWARTREAKAVAGSMSRHGSDLSPVPIALLGPEGRFTSVDDAYCRFLARGPGELVGRSPLAFTHPEDVLMTQNVLARVRSGDPLPLGSRESAVEKRYPLPDGSVVWGRLHLAAMGSPDEPGSVIAQLENITERKGAEDRLLRLAHFDTLTSLPNRSESMRARRQPLRRRISGRPHGLLATCPMTSVHSRARLWVRCPVGWLVKLAAHGSGVAH